MRTLVELVLRAIVLVAGLLLLASATDSVGWIDGSTKLPPLFALGGWDPVGLVAKLTLLLAFASTFVFAVVALPATRSERRIAWANLGYLLGIAGLIATVLIGAIVGEEVRELGSLQWGAGLWLGLVGYAVGGVICFVIARD
jgi:hypothetical protein